MLPSFDFELLYKAWNEFVYHQVVLPEVSPYIARSWKRCWARLNPHRRVEFSKLGTDHLLSAQVAGFNFISLARPIMEDIYQFLEGSDTALLLANSAGYLLDILGDAEMLEVLDSYGIGIGTLLSEGEMGTNAFALSIQERHPLRVAGAEHYLEQFHDIAEAAAPVFDLSGRPLGSIGVVNFFYRHHAHTLGLVVAGARAIEGQHQADYFLAEQNNQMAQLNAIVEASSDGMLIINEHGVVMHINEAATRITGQSRQSVLGRHIAELVTYPGFIDEAVTHRERLKDVEINLGFHDRSVTCVVSLNYVLNNRAIRWVIITLRQEKEVRELVQQQVGAQAPLTLDDIPGESLAIRRIQRFVKMAAPAKASILIRGESGTGKNVLASAIHNASPHREGPFLIIGCTSIPHEWVISELLGYEEGLDPKKPGGRPSKFELANGGTLFFQNIDDLPLEAQAILINVLDLGIIQRLGSDRPIAIDVRIIASTTANIEKLIAQGNFRADLYYRLSIFEITLPPLRERMRDIPVLIDRILTRLSRQLSHPIVLEPGAKELLTKYHWPGNVRELEAVLGRAAVQSGRVGVIGPLLLPSHIQNTGNQTQTEMVLKIDPLYKVERDVILQAAQACRGNVSAMAKALGIGRTTVWRRLKEMSIELDEYRYGDRS